METATFGAGCFWGVEVAFGNIPGVAETKVGYSGGSYENPTYRDVCRGDTGHTEVVQVRYDPDQLSYESLLDAFWQCHDPTQVNRQGPDFGYQYRSVIFWHSDRQRTVAEASKQRLQASGAHASPVATAIEPASVFYDAEEYHQKYLEKRGLAACHV